LRVINPDAEKDDHEDEDEDTGHVHDAVEEGDGNLNVKAYRAKRVAKLRKNEAALRLKVAQWWQGVQDVMGPNEAIVSTSQGLVISVIFSVLG
jgi:hypothetical protein